jgi:hypothetical protein
MVNSSDLSGADSLCAKLIKGAIEVKWVKAKVESKSERDKMVFFEGVEYDIFINLPVR